jgi:hypothetical protein
MISSSTIATELLPSAALVFDTPPAAMIAASANE